MKGRLRNALILIIIALGVFIAAEQTGLIGSDISGHVFHFLVWES